MRKWRRENFSILSNGSSIDTQKNVRMENFDVVCFVSKFSSFALLFPYMRRSDFPFVPTGRATAASLKWERKINFFLWWRKKEGIVKWNLFHSVAEVERNFMNIHHFPILSDHFHLPRRAFASSLTFFTIRREKKLSSLAILTCDVRLVED